MEDVSTLNALLEAGGTISLAAVCLFFAWQFWKAYRAQVAAHIKTLKLAARLPLSDDDTMVRRPADEEKIA
jgi:hypothetical protein